MRTYSSFQIGDLVQSLQAGTVLVVKAVHANNYLTCWHEGPDNERIVVMSPTSEFRAASTFQLPPISQNFG